MRRQRPRVNSSVTGSSTPRASQFTRLLMNQRRTASSRYGEEEQYSLVAASDEDAGTWLERRYAAKVEQVFDRGIYLPADGIDDQLSQSQSIVLLAERYPDAAKELLAAAAEDRDLTVVVFGLPGESALVGGRILRPVSDAMVRATRHKGFRKGAMPPHQSLCSVISRHQGSNGRGYIEPTHPGCSRAAEKNSTSAFRMRKVRTCLCWRSRFGRGAHARQSRCRSSAHHRSRHLGLQ